MLPNNNYKGILINLDDQFYPRIANHMLGLGIILSSLYSPFVKYYFIHEPMAVRNYF